MTAEKQTAFEERLTALERELAATRVELSTTRALLQRTQNQQRRTGKLLAPLYVLAGAATLLGLMAGLSTPITGQGPGAVGQTVKAPFKVVDKSGKIILRVEEELGDWRGLIVQNSREEVAALLTCSKSGVGFVSARDKNGANASLSVRKDRGSGELSVEGPGERALGTFGAAGVKVFNKNEKLVAQLGANSVVDAGELAIANKEGKVTAVVSVDELGAGQMTVQKLGDDKDKTGGGRAVLAIDKEGQAFLRVRGLGGKVSGELNAGGLWIHNKDGQIVAKFGRSEGGANGYLMIGNAEGNKMVEAGVAKGDKGLVQCSPKAEGAPRPYPTFLLGGGK